MPSFRAFALWARAASTGRKGGRGRLSHQGAAKRGRGPGPKRAGRGGLYHPVRMSGTLRVVLAMGALAALNLYVLYYRHGTSVPALLRAAEVGRQASLVPGLSGPPGTPPQVVRSRHGAKDEGLRRDFARVTEAPLKADDALDAVLSRIGLKPEAGAQVAAALEKDFEAGSDQKLVLFYDLEGQLQVLDYQKAPDLGFRVERVVTGSTERWTSTRQEGLLSMKPAVVGGTVARGATLVDTVQRIGEGRSLPGMLAEVFAYDLDLPADSHEGDRFRVVVEKIYRGGGFYRYGRILAARYDGQSGSRWAFYDAAGQTPGYVDETGAPLQRALRRSPLRRVSVAQKPGEPRRTPSLHLERGRLAGADFPAAVGTPVLALAPGTVTALSQKGKAGVAVTVAQADGDKLEVQYGQLLRAARGLASGAKVAAGQLIGYVGPAPAKSRPHLHLSLRVAGKVADPLKWRAPAPAADPARAARLAATIKDLRERLEPAALARTP